MRIRTLVMAAMAASVIGCATARAGDGDFLGQWRVIDVDSRYSLTFKPAKIPGRVSGTFVNDERIAGYIEPAEVKGNELTGDWQAPGNSGTIGLTMSPDGASFQGEMKLGPAQSRHWRGFRPPPGFTPGPTDGVAVPQGKRFAFPHIATDPGHYVLLDWCREWATDCGQAAADQFCSTQEGGRHPKAVDFKEFKRAVRFNPSMTIGTRQVCNDIDCSAFEYVTCGGGGVVTSDSGLPSSGGGSSATIVIPEPNLHKLNVRSAPGGSVLGTLPEGTTVSVVGECGSTVAGLGPATGGAPLPATGWCEIDAPLRGFVSAKYLEFGAAGLAAATPGQQPHASSPDDGFAGIWDAATGDGTSYVITLHRKGNGVSGSYRGGDGSRGEIDGKLKNRGQVLDFTWRQTDGNGGLGRFRLTEGGEAFQGTYALSRSPNKVEGGWNGTRR